MKSYELTYIISPDLSSADAETLKQDIEAFIKNKEGVILRSDKLSMQTLSYRIKKQNSGYFAVVEFQLEENAAKALTGMLETHSKVLRHLLLIKKPAKVMKERRTRKPSLAAVGASATTEAKKGEKVEVEEMEKKLDEMLSE